VIFRPILSDFLDFCGYFFGEFGGFGRKIGEFGPKRPEIRIFNGELGIFGSVFI
jgi:hypothetical protein